MVAEDATPSLLDELLAESRPASKGCQVCLWLEERDDAAQWDSAFQNDRITVVALTNGMRRRGFTFKNKPVATHRHEKHRVAA